MLPMQSFLAYSLTSHNNFSSMQFYCKELQMLNKTLPHQWYQCDIFFPFFFFFLATCARKPRVSGSSTAASYAQRKTTCSNRPANV